MNVGMRPCFGGMSWLRHCAAIALVLAAPRAALSDIVTSQKSCTPQQSQEVAAAVTQSKAGMTKAVGILANPSPAEVDRFARWFGAPSSSAAAAVKATFERALFQATFQQFWCPVVNSNELQWSINEIAAFWPPTPTAIYLAPYFFDIAKSGAVSQAGTIVHELVHVPAVVGAGDVDYGLKSAEALAKTKPEDARRNADNYRFYIEDILFGLPR